MHFCGSWSFYDLINLRVLLTQGIINILSDALNMYMELGIILQ